MLGGQWSIACLQHGKEIYRDILKHLENSVHDAGVKVQLNTTVTLDTIRGLSPDVVVLATGSLPKTIDIPGIVGSNVFQAVDVIKRAPEVGEKVLVIGGRLIGMEVALDLSEKGKRVSVATARRLGENGAKLEENIYRTLRDRLIARGVAIYPGCPVLEIREDGAYFDDDGNIMFLEAETIILAIGAVPRNEMFDKLQSIVPETYAIGDCLAARDGLDAVHDGADLGMRL
jgi:2-enoate reductase